MENAGSPMAVVPIGVIDLTLMSRFYAVIPLRLSGRVDEEVTPLAPHRSGRANFQQSGSSRESFADDVITHRHSLLGQSLAFPISSAIHAVS